MNKQSKHNHHSAQTKRFLDPVCGMSTEDKKSFKAHEHDGDQFYFCSDKCLSKFVNDPQAYTGKRKVQSPSKDDASMSSSIYTCPMHPEIEQIGPGSCPKCGMALERLIVSMDDEENPEYDYMLKRFIFSAVLSVPLIIIAMREMLPGGQVLENLASAQTLGWLELVLSTPVIVWAGWPFYVRGVQSVINKSLNMFTLIGLGVSMSYSYSLIAVLLPGIFPAAMRGQDGAVGVYFEAAAVIVTLILLGQVMELRARNQTGAAIKALLGLAPKTARKFNADGS